MNMGMHTVGVLFLVGIALQVEPGSASVFMHDSTAN